MRSFLTLLLFLCSIPLSSQIITLSGYIKDVESGEALQEANVYSVAGKRSCTTNKAGYYRLYLPAGEVDLNCSYVGYTTRKLNFTLTRDTVINITLKQDNRLKDIVVYAPRKDYGVQSSQISTIEIPIAQIKSTPALFGEVDVMKVLQLLPGVQSGGDGNAGIYVRGGNYDQNMITLDGSTLYNADHLKGFVSALNADVISNVVLYKGGFPARYGSRLSSVVDVGISEGDYERYHAALTLGMLSSKVHVEGPIIKGKTSFNVAARLSYFDLIVQPALEKIYDNKNVLASFANMNYYDINAKVTHKLSGRSKLSAVFYLGNDVVDTAPTDSKQEYDYSRHDGEGKTRYNFKAFRSNYTSNTWGNLVSSLYWSKVYNANFTTNVNLSYSQYRYKLTMGSSLENELTDLNKGKMQNYSKEDSYAHYNSKISDIALAVDAGYRAFGDLHNIKFGGKYSRQNLTPIVDVYKYTLTKALLDDDSYLIEENTIDTLVGRKMYLNTLALYAEDDLSLGRYVKANVGLRYTLFGVEGKSYHSLEPRFSGRVLLQRNLAFKASFSLMRQGIHLLSSSNLVMPSDIWVPVTDKIAPMKSYQYAASLNYELEGGIDISVEGYYKKMHNVLEYMEGTSYMNATGDWEKMVATGRGRSYGAELFLQKKTGRTTGWLSYTWSKSLRRFDTPGQEINGGKEFYAGNDRRHNLNITVAYRMGKHFELSGTFVLNSGRGGTLAMDVIYSGSPDEYDSYYIASSPSSSHIMIPDTWTTISDGATYFRKYSRFHTYSERNNYQLPLYHRLDVGLSYFVFHKKGKSTFNLSIYNLYNQQNISSVYVGYKNNRTVLKGVCLLPFMPSLSYTYQF